MDSIQFGQPSKDLGQVGYILGLLKAMAEGVGHVRETGWLHMLAPAGTTREHLFCTRFHSRIG